ncbi:MAG: class I SAM-dependent methyltransferase [Verrucomicrobia bacterium]|nr:class I SAM-dependent methyltransferase [Verrucomicrobiota bacterium]
MVPLTHGHESEINRYYSARAPYLGKALEVPPSGQTLEIIAELKSSARGLAVLEIACGTGYWTRFVAPCAREAMAIDFSEEMLEVARSQQIVNARFLREDAYSLKSLESNQFDFGFAMHWLSHIPLARWDEFFSAFHARLKPGAKVLVADDIRRPDDEDLYFSRVETRDSYELRRLPNGQSYEIVKRYFAPDELHALLAPYATNLHIRFVRPRWWLTYEVVFAEF